MRALFIILMAANILMFGLGQGWFGSANIEPGRQPAMIASQLNADALTVKVGRLQDR